MTTPNQAPQGEQQPAAPAPDSPEYIAQMVSAFENQDPNAAPAAPATSATEETPKDPPVAEDPNAPAPKLTDDPDAPKDEPKPDEKPKDGENTEEKPNDEAKEPTQWAKAFEDGTFLNEFNAEKPSEDFVKNLAGALGLTTEQVTQMQAQFRAGQLALVEQTNAKLYEAAGGKESFNQLIAWGQKNLTPEQRAFYDQQLNGPDAIATVQLLRQRMNVGRDPQLAQVNGGASGPVTAFRDQAEMIAAMADPKYHSSPAYRADVEARMRLSPF